MKIRIEFDREVDGRWIAEAHPLPGVLAYGATKKEAQAKVISLALAVISAKVRKRTARPPKQVTFA